MQKRKCLKGMRLTAALFMLAAAGFFLYMGKQMEKIPEMTAQDCLSYTLAGKPEGRIAAAVLKDGEVHFHLYGEDGKEIPPEPIQFEIGSLTKTMTAALVQQAASEGKMDLDETVDVYLGYESAHKSPSVRALLTHTSGCKGYYFAAPFIQNFFTGGNSFLNVTREIVWKQGRKLNLDRAEYPWTYSNFGFALLGLVLEAVEERPMEDQLNGFLKDLGMENSLVSIGQSTLPGGWQWNKGDAYIPAGAVVSDIEDMAKYASAQLEEGMPFALCHEKQMTVDASPEQWKRMDIHADAMGLSWIIDKENGFIWHNGGTGHYNAYLGFCPETKTAVVVLSNLAPDYKIPATVVGVKLLKALQ